MMPIEDFAAALDVPEQLLADAYDIFREELTAHQKTLAHRTADLATGLQQIGVDHPAVLEAVQMLARERRR